MPSTAIINDIKKGEISPVYLLGGDESYFIDQVVNYCENTILDESEKAFNLDVFYGMEVDPVKVQAICREFPMMANRRLVIIKEGHKTRDLDKLDSYILNPSQTTVLIIAMKGKKFDLRKKVYNPKKNKNIVVLNSVKIKDYKLPEWIINYTRSKGYVLNFEIATMLSEYLGSNLNTIIKELEKLFISKKPGETISSTDIERNIGISKDFNVFELQKAIGFKDVKKVNQIALYFADNPKAHPFVLTLGILNNYFTQLMRYYYSKDKSDNGLAAAIGTQPFFVKDYKLAARNYPPKRVVEIISILREYDMKAKGFETAGINEGEWLKEMIFKIMN